MKTLATISTPRAERIALLTKYVGQRIYIRNVADADALEGARLRFHLAGILEAAEDPYSNDAEGEWYVRIGEEYHGVTGINFHIGHIVEIDELQGGAICIVVK